MMEHPDALQTVKDFIRWGATRFAEAGLHFGHGTDNALDEAAALVLHTLHLPSDLSPVWLDSRLTSAERQRVLRLLQRRIDEKVPAAYLTQEARFAGLSFYVNEHVLIPRSPIAELIEQGFEPWLGGRLPGRILDLCTGSGCIAVACAYQFPEAEVDAADISREALEVARVNVERHQVEDQVRLVRADLFEGLDGGPYDLIVSNPPYVGVAEMAGLPTEYHHEPAIGLAAGSDGLDLVRRILREASRHLTADGIIIMEVGASAGALMGRYPEVPFLWLDFERGGEGVFLLTAGQLKEFQRFFDRQAE